VLRNSASGYPGDYSPSRDSGIVTETQATRSKRSAESLESDSEGDFKSADGIDDDIIDDVNDGDYLPPKRKVAHNPWHDFIRENMAMVVKRYPFFTHTQVMKTLGNMWQQKKLEGTK
jgi:hypothetical protein